MSAALLILAALLAQQLKAPAIIPKQRGGVIARSNRGVDRWSADWTMEPWTDNGRRAVRFTETGKGIYSPFTQAVNWKLESIWLAENGFFPLHFEKTFKDSSGRVLAIERKEFDPKKATLRFERQDAGGRVEAKSLPAPPGTLAIEGIAGILGFFPFGSSGSIEARLLTNEPELYEVELRPRGIERIHTSRGDKDCYKIEVVPQLGLRGIFLPLYAKTYFWFAVDAPYAWMRYEGYENGRGTPEIVMELK